MLALPSDCIGEIIGWANHLTKLQLSYTCHDFTKYLPYKIPADELLRVVALTSSLSLYGEYYSGHWINVWRFLMRDYSFLVQIIRLTDSECFRWIINRFSSNSSTKTCMIMMQFAISCRSLEDIEWLWSLSKKKLYFVRSHLSYRREICYPVVGLVRPPDDVKRILKLIDSDWPHYRNYEVGFWKTNIRFEMWLYRSNNLKEREPLSILGINEQTCLFREALDFGYTDLALEILKHMVPRINGHLYSLRAPHLLICAALKQGDIRVLTALFDEHFPLHISFHLTPRNTRMSLLDLVLKQPRGIRLLKRATFGVDDFCILSQDHLAALEVLASLGSRFPYTIWRFLYGEYVARWVIVIRRDIHKKPVSVPCIMNYVRYCLRRKNSDGLRISSGDLNAITWLYNSLKGETYHESRTLFSAIITSCLASPFAPLIDH